MRSGGHGGIIGGSVSVTGQTSDSKQHDGGTRSYDTNSRRHTPTKKKDFGRSPATVISSDSDLQSKSKNLSRSRQNSSDILSNPKKHGQNNWWDSILCGMNSNC